MTAAQYEGSGSYVLAGEDLLEAVKQAVRDDRWQFTMLGGSIIMRRDPTRIRQEIERSRRGVGTLA